LYGPFKAVAAAGWYYCDKIVGCRAVHANNIGWAANGELRGESGSCSNAHLRHLDIIELTDVLSVRN
jgi:hypothetical protein